MTSWPSTPNGDTLAALRAISSCSRIGTGPTGSSSPGCGAAVNLIAVTEPGVKLGAECPRCGEPWLRPTAVPGRYRCVHCMQRYELVSVCPNCGEHSTIVRMSSTAIVACNHCQGSMLRAV